MSIRVKPQSQEKTLKQQRSIAFLMHQLFLKKYLKISLKQIFFVFFNRFERH